jgi:hypothetical protein
MTHGDWLQTLAEIGLGFAGFSALIAGMRGSDETPDLENASRGRAVVETSLCSLFGCAIPVMLIGLGLNETTAFRWAGALFLLVGAPLTVRGFRRAAATRRSGRPFQPVLGGLNVIGGLAGLGFSLACVIGRPESSVPTYYLGAILGILGISAINFAGFVFAINEDAATETD